MKLSDDEIQTARVALQTIGPIPPHHPELGEWESRLVAIVNGDDRMRRAVIALARGIRPEVALDTTETEDGKPWDDRHRSEKLSPSYGSQTGQAGRWPCGGGRRVIDKPGGQEG